jgi:hypothetical protein
MAVLDAVPGLDVSICIDDQQLEEYSEDEEEEVEETPIAEYQAAKTVRKYVESVSDKEFEVRIVLGTSFVLNYDCVLAPNTIDSKRVPEPVIVKSHHSHLMRGSRILSDVVRKVDGVTRPASGANEQVLLQKFRFAKIDTSQFLLLSRNQPKSLNFSAADDSKLTNVKQDMKRVE